MINIIIIYTLISIAILTVTAVMAIHGEIPDEIDTFWDWFIYGSLWGIILLKHFVKFIIKIITK